VFDRVYDFLFGRSYQNRTEARFHRLPPDARDHRLPCDVGERLVGQAHGRKARRNDHNRIHRLCLFPRFVRDLCDASPQ
jgi:hypothetical protein